MAEEFHANDDQHLRFNPLTGDWILVSPHRTKRPWSGQVEKIADDDIPDFDPSNPLCPGVVRPNGERNEEYTSTFVFNNDYPALLKQVASPPDLGSPFFQMRKATGECKVICFHPKSNVTLPLMKTNDIVQVIKTWQAESLELSKTYDWVQIFENKGAIMGCSNPHPHCQIWASDYLPNEPRKELQALKDFYEKQEKDGKKAEPFLIQYGKKEMELKERIVVENSSWLVVVPFWATWPFETLLIPKENFARIEQLSDDSVVKLAEIMKSLLIKYDNLFNISFPYTMGWHGAPGPFTSGKEEPHKYWTLHAHYYPPLLRSATVKKFMVGYEMLAGAQRDLTPEQAAKILRELTNVHYKERQESKRE